MKRFLALALAMLMVLSVCMIAGCGETETTETTTANKQNTETTTNGNAGNEGTTTNGGADNETTTNGGNEETTTTEDTADTTPAGYGKLAGYEDVDFGGKTFVIAGADGSSDGFNTCKEVYSEEADAISVAVRNRNLIMKQLYNCNIELHSSDGPASAAMNEVTSN